MENNNAINTTHDLSSMGARAHAYLINPKDPRVESRAVVFLEKLEVDVHEVRGLEGLHHSHKDIDVSRPFPFNSGNWFRSELPGFLCLLDIIVDIANIAPEDDSCDMCWHCQITQSDVTNSTDF